MRDIALIDVGASNVFNVELALQRLGLTIHRVDRTANLAHYDAVVFPGVAHFGYVMRSLEERGLVAPLRDAIEGGVPYLGICVGMQVLFESSEEAPGEAGLGLLRGRVQRLRAPKVPQLGWNELAWRGEWAEVGPGWTYFANSFAAPADIEDAAALAEYGEPFAAACARGSLAAFQFHPERSGKYGRRLLAHFFETAPVLHAR